MRTRDVHTLNHSSNEQTRVKTTITTSEAPKTQQNKQTILGFGIFGRETVMFP